MIVVSATMSGSLSAQVLPECKPAITNRACVITVNRDAASSPLPVRLAPDAAVRLVVNKRPLDDITVDATVVNVATPDPVSAILSAFVPLAKATIFDARLVGGPIGSFHTLENPSERFKGNHPSIDALLNQLGWIRRQQEALKAQLLPSKQALDAALAAFSAVTFDDWNMSKSLAVRRDAVAAQLQQASGSDTGSGLAGGLHDAMATATRAFAALATAADQPGVEDLKAIGNLLNDTTASQAAIDASSASLVAATNAARDAATVLSKLNPDTALTFTRVFNPDPSARAKSATLKVKTEDRISKKAADLGTVVVTWADTRWEVSAGALFSFLTNRSFQNTVANAAGQTQVDAGGKTNTTITETDTRPTVIPFAFAHFRIVEGANYDRRLALLATGGMGISPYSGSTDFAAGLSVAYRALVISPVAHFGRDSRLTGGLQVGASLGSSPPALPVERFWTTTFGVAVTARIF
jgi:hypothetical protein